MRHVKWLSLAGMLAALVACDRDRERTEPTVRTEPQTPQTQPAQPAKPAQPAPGNVKPAAAKADEADDAKELVNDAAETLQKMRANEGIRKLMERAKGMLIVPEYGRGAAGVGLRGGEGILLAQKDGKWSSPMFYNIGGVSVGAQFGAEGGEIAMLLMNDKALERFHDEASFSLNVGADLTIVDFSAMSQAEIGKEGADVVFWSDTEGAFAGATLSATNIAWDGDENRSYYGREVTSKQVLSGAVKGEMGALEKELTAK